MKFSYLPYISNPFSFVHFAPIPQKHSSRLHSAVISAIHFPFILLQTKQNTFFSLKPQQSHCPPHSLSCWRWTHFQLWSRQFWTQTSKKQHILKHYRLVQFCLLLFLFFYSAWIVPLFLMTGGRGEISRTTSVLEPILLWTSATMKTDFHLLCLWMKNRIVLDQATDKQRKNFKALSKHKTVEDKAKTDFCLLQATFNLQKYWWRFWHF